MRAVKVSRGRIQYPYVESVRGHGFGRRTYVDTSKNEATWCRMPGYYDVKYDSTLRAFEGWWHGRYFAHYGRFQPLE